MQLLYVIPSLCKYKSTLWKDVNVVYIVMAGNLRCFGKIVKVAYITHFRREFANENPAWVKFLIFSMSAINGDTESLDVCG